MSEQLQVANQLPGAGFQEFHESPPRKITMKSDLRARLEVLKAAARAIPDGDTRKIRLNPLLFEASQCLGVTEARLSEVERLLDQDGSNAAR